MKIEEVKQLLEKDKETVTDLNSLNELKVKYLGKKEYSSLLTCFSIDVQCQHFTRKGDKKYETYKL